jgi:cell wall-associated NlpC family hydrolase
MYTQYNFSEIQISEANTFLQTTRAEDWELLSGGILSGVVSPWTQFSDAGTPMSDERWQAMKAEAERHLGRPYVWGGSTPQTSFDCSGFVRWVINNSPLGFNVGRQTAQTLFNQVRKIRPEDARPGDLIFFHSTYSTSDSVTHIGIYAGDGKMIHAGDPIAYANTNSTFWQSHFYAFGRL